MLQPTFEVLPPWPLLAAFFAASLVLAVTPGPGVLYIVTRSLAQGRRPGLASVAGVALGNLGNALGAAFGLGALLAVSSAAFLVVKYAGAAYLLHLGIRALRASPGAVGPAPPDEKRYRAIFRDGFIVALFNPKTAVFFAAFLPQFVSAGAATMQIVTLGTLFVLIAGATDTIYAVAAGTLAPWLTRARRVRSVGRYLTGGSFIGLGLFAAFAGTRSRP